MKTNPMVLIAIGLVCLVIGVVMKTTGGPAGADPALAAQCRQNLTERGGDADLIAIARGALYDPRWPWHAAAQLGDQVTAPPQYLRSQPREYKDLFGG